MPVSTFFGLQTSLRGLLAHQRALDTTGHNVANAATPGYSRQEAVLGAAPALSVPAGALQSGGGAQIGAGVDVLEYRRVRDAFLDLQYRAQAMQLGDADARARSLDQVELALAEPGTNGLAHQLGKFWSAWQNLANDPSSLAARQTVIDQGRTVAAAFATLDGQLQTVASQARDEMQGVNDEIGIIASELGQVGEAIRRAVAANQQPNDLMDRRDLLLDRLSTLGQVSVADLGDGGIRVLFGGSGTPLVDDVAGTVNWPQTPPPAAPGGKLGALMDLERTGGVVDTYRTELAAVASGLAAAVNGLHAQGAPPALNFFAYDPALRGSGLSVAVTAAQVETGRASAPGANDLAREIGALRGGAVDEAYEAFIGGVGSDVRRNTRAQQNSEVLLGAVEDRRSSVAGVSLDEEMTNLVRFQRGYQASARAMSTLDEMLDVLINRTGRVGL
jgi:flagellar hook-associated protein 1